MFPLFLIALAVLILSQNKKASRDPLAQRAKEGYSMPPNPSPQPSTPKPKTVSPPPPVSHPVSLEKWSPSSEFMYMAHGRNYEMRPTVSTMGDKLNDGTVKQSGLPLTILAQKKGSIPTPLGLADGVIGIIFRWDGPSGTARFPSWAWQQTEIRTSPGPAPVW